MPGVLRLRGQLDVEALQRAVQTMVERHEVLRTRFAEQDGEPVQVIERYQRVEMPVEDVSGLESRRAGAAGRGGDAGRRWVSRLICGEGR